jgi:hypothetical protein
VNKTSSIHSGSFWNFPWSPHSRLEQCLSTFPAGVTLSARTDSWFLAHLSLRSPDLKHRPSVLPTRWPTLRPQPNFDSTWMRPLSSWCGLSGKLSPLPITRVPNPSNLDSPVSPHRKYQEQELPPSPPSAPRKKDGGCPCVLL